MGNEIRRDVDARHRRADARRGKREVAGSARHVEHALAGLEPEPRDELAGAAHVAFRDAAEIAGGPGRANAIRERVERSPGSTASWSFVVI